MTTTFAVTLIVLAGLIAGAFGFAAGIKYQKGTEEVATMLREEEDAKRGERPGTIKLKTMRIRR
jgi:hypothetical protein